MNLPPSSSIGPSGLAAQPANHIFSVPRLWLDTAAAAQLSEFLVDIPLDGLQDFGVVSPKEMLKPPLLFQPIGYRQRFSRLEGQLPFPILHFIQRPEI